MSRMESWKKRNRSKRNKRSNKMTKDMNVFKGSDNYVVTDELMNAVNVSIALKKPLLIKG